MNPILVRKRPWWRVLLLVLGFLVSGSGTMRAISVVNGDYTYVTSEPSNANGSYHVPYFELKMLYFDWTMYANSFWEYEPDIYVDGFLVGTGHEIAQFAKDGVDYGDGYAARDAANNVDLWWGDPIDNTDKKTGVKYRVRFRSPFCSCETYNKTKFSCYMRVYIGSMESGSTHTVRIKGKWMYNQERVIDIDKTWTFKAPTFWNDSNAPTLDMTDYNHVTVSGNLNKNYGPTTVGFYSNDEGATAKANSSYFTYPFVDRANLKSRKEYEWSTASFSNQTATHNRSDQSHKNGSTAAVEYVIPVDDNNFTTNFYKCFNVTVPGFALPQNLTAEDNQWAKSITLKWKADADWQQTNDNRRCKEGSWYIYRGEEKIATVAYSEANMSYTDTQVPDYDVNYEYKVAFVPKNTPSGTKYNSLATSITKNLARQWSFDNFGGALVDDDAHIKLTWKHNAIKDASGSKPYTLSLYRSDDDGATWGEAIYTTNITSSTTTEGTYTDKQDLQANHTYIYKLVINLLGTDFSAESSPVTLGGSQLKEFTASRGDYNNVVKLQWTVKQVGADATSFAIFRRPLGSEEEKDWARIFTTSGTGSVYSYDDTYAQQGTYNEYKVAIIDKSNSATTYGYLTTDGFTYSTGVISGRIKYGTGTAVEGVKVKLKQQDADGDLTTAGMRSLHFSGQGAGMGYQTDNNEIQQLFGNDFSVQMWVKPMKEEMGKDGQDYLLFDVTNVFSIRLWYRKADNTYRVGGWMGGNEQSSIYIPADKWSHLTFIHSKADATTKVIVATPDEVKQANILSNKTVDWTDNLASQSSTIAIGNSGGLDYAYNYGGFMDEVRLFTKALTEKDVKRNYNHPLAGNETGLAIYYPFDEGLKKQRIAYDYSKTNGVANGRHSRTGVTAYSSTDVPAEEQLCMMNFTDSLGNYTIRGIHFQGEGIAYSVIPEFNIHEFSPSAKSCFISTSSLVHSGIDFEDVSSFPVKGRVIYAGTDYPVEDVNFYVDGNICAKNGEIVSTNEKGEFTISVPIGDHFIRVVKSGHVFANDGRYPADPNDVGTLFTFNDSISNMEFQDETLVNFTGRVVGGSIQGDKAVGFGLSTNNIGVTELVLTPINDNYRLNVKKEVSGTTYDIINNPDNVTVASATGLINSTSWRKGGSTKADCQQIIINTDPATGEFSAMLPPIMYNVGAMKLKKTGDIVGEATTIDLTNPSMVLNDTLYNEAGDEYELYEYNTMLKQAYHTPATFIVKQEGHDDGSFGIDSYKLTDDFGNLNINDIYTVSNGQVHYKYYDSPLFIKGDSYTFFLEGYESYTNVDNGIEDHVPLDGSIVTISNALSSEQKVYFLEVNGHVPGETDGLQENQLKLDSDGKAIYKWKAGLPNIAEPFQRTISMTYEINDRSYPWSGNGMKGIILGELPTGSNFITAGPQKVSMVLRDPPGTNSFAEWKSGTTKTVTTLSGTTFNQNSSASFKHKFGFENAIVIGTGIATVQSIEAANDLEVGAKMEYENESSTSIVETTSVTKTISTSAAPEYVGAQGDVYIGRSTNILFGKVRNVGFRRVAGGNTAEIALEDVMQTGIEFGTMFMYTQNYIENVMLPNYELLRKKFLKTTTQDSINSYVNKNDHTVYLTTLSPDDENFGADNTYTVFKAPNAAFATDSVAWINMQIENWEQRLADNEKDKVKAFENRSKYLVGDNLSFDSGTTYNYEISEENDTTTTRDWTIKGGVVIDDTWGLAINKFGFNIHLTDETLGGEHHTTDSLNVSTNTFSYTLAEDGDDDALSVDVLNYGNFGPIFHTRAGQTCCPYEGKVVTKYYEPGTTIMEATMKIEVPQIDVDVPVMSDVPSGQAANYTLRLSNASEIDEDVYYRLLVDDESNPNGANLTIDGRPVTDSRIIKIPAGQTVTKALQLKQTDPSILDYEKIALVLGSQCQIDPTSTWEVIADTVYISAHFVPSSSPVDLALSNNIINTHTGTDLTLTFSGFDRNYRGLKAFRLQYKKQGATDWTLLKEYVLKDPTQNNELLPETGAKVDFLLPMASFSDGNYLFRCVSASTYGSEEVYRYSNELALVKDMQRPTPLGMPEPSDGILDAGDDISITFNEPFLNGELTKSANFLITGALNGSEIAHETALSMSSSSDVVATAQTEASINLADKDFSIDLWVNITSAGTLLSHGQGKSKLTVGTNADGKLVVTIGDNTSVYTSTSSVPTGKWAFLTMNMTANGKLSASIASADETVALFEGKEVPAYEGNGPLSVGCGSTAAMHELLLWDEAHDLSTALMNRSKTKNPATRHLIGYWKMDEGEGKEIRDYARNRHMTMPNETWYLNNENKAVVLDGSHYVSINAATLPLNAADDYTVEFWMRNGKQTGDAQLMQMGDVALSMNTDGELLLTGKGASLPAAQQTANLKAQGVDLRDDIWHHIALNVLRQGAAAVYVDGKRCLTTNADNVGSIVTNKLIVGAHRISNYEEGYDEPTYSYDRAFKGEIDEIRVWGATLNGDQIAKNRKQRFTGSEAGLVAYYPFETKTLDAYNQVVTTGSPDDLTNSGLQAQLVGFDGNTQAPVYTDNAPALRTKKTETNVSFSYTASNEKIVIDIDEDPAKVEGCTLNFTVRDVRDQNGNYSLPTVWSAYIKRNELEWADDVLSIEQQVKSQSTLTATIVNKGGKQQMWTIDGMPAWLTASADYGTTNPRSETTVTFTVSPATPIGKYEETIYLTGNNGIETPLTINVKVTGNVPEWNVTPAQYENSMNVIARVEINGKSLDDEDDLVAAFIDDECRGIAHPVYNERFDDSFITIDIYGNNETGKDVTFRAYDASTGTLYPVVTTKPTIGFTPLALIGKYSEPVILTAANLIEQQTELKAGWNWLSFSVKPEDMTVPAIFEKIADDVMNIKSQNDGYLTYEDQQWGGSLTKSLSNTQMYAVQMKADRTLRIVGERVDPESTVINVCEGWNWIGYYGRQVASVSDAFAGLQPENGDVLKGQSGVSYFDTYEWVGSLPMVEPGLGYMLKSATSYERQFSYPAATVAGARMTQPTFHAPAIQTTPAQAATSTVFTPVNFRKYSDNAIMAVKVVDGSKALGNIELGVFAGDALDSEASECRAAAFTNSEGIAYLTIPGDVETTLSFKVALGDQLINATTTLNYEVDGVYGSPKHPIVIDLSDQTGIREIASDEQGASVYDLQGRKVVTGQSGHRKLSKGIYIVNGQKKATIK